MAMQDWIEQYPAVKALLDTKAVPLEYTSDVIETFLSPSASLIFQGPGRTSAVVLNRQGESTLALIERLAHVRTALGQAWTIDWQRWKTCGE